MNQKGFSHVKWKVGTGLFALSISHLFLFQNCGSNFETSQGPFSDSSASESQSQGSQQSNDDILVPPSGTDEEDPTDNTDDPSNPPVDPPPPQGILPDAPDRILNTYQNLTFSDEFSEPLDIGMEAGRKWRPGWVKWATRHLAGNSDRAWKMLDSEKTWDSTSGSWVQNPKTVHEVLSGDERFRKAHGAGPYNHEVSEGTLKLRAFRVPESLQKKHFGGFEFTGSMISTEDSYAFRFGYLETRIRFNKVNQGMHFGFWTLSQDNKRWKQDYGPEIDQLEVLYRDPAKGIERPKHWHQNVIGLKPPSGFPFFKVTPDYSQWHTVGVERSSDGMIRFYMDGQLTREVNAAGQSQYTDENHYFLMTWEVSGNWPGAVLSTDPDWFVEAEVDYIRLYEP